jgi:hypothetical protein
MEATRLPNFARAAGATFGFRLAPQRPWMVHDRAAVQVHNDLCYQAHSQVGSPAYAQSAKPTQNSGAAANPKSKTFDTPVDDVFKAAKKAAVGHRILIPQDEGLKDLTDSGEEIKSFRFATALPGVTFPVIAEISIEPLPDGTTKVEITGWVDR